MSGRRVACALLACGLATAAARGAGTRSYTVDPARSRATIAVGKSGVFSFAAGHTHEVVAPAIAGTMRVDVDNPSQSSVQITLDAAALKVTGKGESADDVPKVQETMAGPQVLDVHRFPKMTFASSSIEVTSRTGAALQAKVTGELRLRDVARTISVPVSVRIEGATLTASGTFPVKQTDYGIKPVSVGGVVSVKDAVNVSFTIVGR
jgi:polyisoprenoid-binding protein YceI